MLKDFSLSATAPVRVVNRLIEGLPRRERHWMLEQCEPMELDFGDILCEPDQPFRYVYFPLTGFISLVTSLQDHQPLEMGLIGNEGMLGGTIVLGISAVPLRAVVQGAGVLLRMTSVQLRKEMQRSPALRRALQRYLYVQMAQLSQIGACTHFHEIEPRLARWLLMTHDRAHADHFRLTHEQLANMLGVRRSGISVAAGVLRRRKLIRYTRGEIHILNREGLEAAACECYGALVEDYAKLLA